MRAFTRLPVPVLIMEALGVIMLVASYLVLHQMLPLPAAFAGPLTATILVFAGIALMLPAAALMMWRTAKALAPELFSMDRPHDKNRPGDNHDADH
ncbi:YbjC family protein [Erwinia sp. P6884]|uniref:YbjC family protein n=1 Tax=Erwinia sp. P6884 TaxID=3141450 RepID=UPI00318C4D66